MGAERIVWGMADHLGEWRADLRGLEAGQVFAGGVAELSSSARAGWELVGL
ncbi:hypothetical protein EV651_105341 [Kribbella sp. VKM Ac-2571]|nr:hypothetical protein EV651_105341 [Kribbella sp. VKM Ac-2571]